MGFENGNVLEILLQNFLEGHALQLCGVGMENLSNGDGLSTKPI